MGFFSRDKKADYLIIGLGNPGPKYADTRHNAGFMAVDALAAELGADNWRLRFDALVTQKNVPDTGQLVLAKPQTMMNLSGRAVKGLVKNFNPEPKQIIVIQDDIDLDASTLRIRVGGGHGGHNGIRSIIDITGADFIRIKIGVGRPPGKMDSADYVLQQLRGQALEDLQVSAKLASEAVLLAIKKGVSAAQDKYN